MRRRDQALGTTDESSSSLKGWVNRFKALDVYPKIEEDYADQTAVGACVSIVSAFIMTILFLSELSAYLRLDVTEHVVVDPRTKERLRINFNITFPALPCSAVQFDVMDVSGDQQNDASKYTTWQPVTADGTPRAPAFTDEDYHKLTGHVGHDAESELMAALRAALAPEDHPPEPKPVVMDLKTAFDGLAARAPGCRIWGHIFVNKVAGNFHIAIGSAHGHHGGRHVHQFMISEMVKFNASHTLHHLSFGEWFPGRVHPLDGSVKTAHDAVSHFQYFLKVVPTAYVDASGGQLDTHQFSATEHEHKITPKSIYQGGMDTHKIPGVFFNYDLSPFMIRVATTRKPLSSFLTSVCAIIGGVFTISGLIDSVLYHTDRFVQRTMQQLAATGR